MAKAKTTAVARWAPPQFIAQPVARYGGAARRGSSAALHKARDVADRAKSQLSQYRRKVAESKVPGALMGAGACVAGAAVSGAVAAAAGEEIMGIPTDVGVGLVAATAGIALGQPLLIHAAAGPLAWYAREYTFDAVSGWMEE